MAKLVLITGMLVTFAVGTVVVDNTGITSGPAAILAPD